MKQTNHRTIVLGMLTEVVASIAQAKNTYAFDEISLCTDEAERIAKRAKEEMKRKLETGIKKLLPKQEYRFKTYLSCFEVDTYK